MTVASDVRLVRCPKCENLLSELPDFSLYQCGGCGAVLKAKKNGFPGDGSLKMSDVEDIGTSEAGNISNISEVPMESADVIERGQVVYIHNERMASNGSSISQAESADVLSSSNARKKGKETMRRREDLDDEYSSYSQGVHNRNEGRNGELKVDRPEYVTVHSEKTFYNIRPPIESLRSRHFTDMQGVKSKGTSSYNTNYYYEQGDRGRYLDHDWNGLSMVEKSENGRAELLRKLDELTDQLSRSCEVTERSKGRIGTNQRMGSPTLPDPYPRHHAAYLQEGLTSSHGENKQQLCPDDISAAYLSQNPGFFPYRDGYGPSLQEPTHPLRGHPYEFQGYADTPQQEMFQRLHHQPQSQYMYWPHNENSHGFYDRVNHHLLMLHPHENYFHQPACSCVHCYNKYWHLPPKIGPSGLHDQRSQNEPSNPNYHHHLTPVQHGPRGYGSGRSRLHTSYSQQPLTLSSNDVDSENELNHQRPRKVVVAHRSGKVCQPIAGGAPFIACSNCFELLKLSRKHISLAKNQQKMKCGACSSIILLELGNKGFSMSVSAHVSHVPTEIEDGSSVIVDENGKILHGGSNGGNRTACSDDYDDSVPQFPADQKSNSGESEKLLGHLSSTLTVSEDEKIPENLASKKYSSLSAEPQLTEVESFQHPDFPSVQCPEHCCDDVVVSRFDKGNKSKRSKFDQSTSEHNSVNNPAVATEIDMSLNEFSNSCVSQESMDKSGEAHPMVNKGRDSLFTGLIKKGFKDFTKSKQNVEVGGSEVFVNGRLIPDHLVKKAEKLAGPVQPGEYWYDIQAGFWGVMGHPCLGIVMPNIEEFNYPMPENCAAGNTGVFVNGRELHQKDLDLLVSRGLPKTRHKSYLIEISGKVVDEQSGEELDSLGKLATTVERAKHGFGMRVPRFIAQSQS
ncbi:protein ENHANCED DISEASE RESISTANCE 4 [Sesamum indicum]|uniref:Protein ENHANCED DISEASE RESISTANCE 4 n=1 Tax=Sesamum indicum TaxID=4182 RepID=A0A6I9UNQ0_SESIN|nr:protein ENHANCED DISEASE RESISTANCE 4 [Sesamum indicum]